MPNLTLPAEMMQYALTLCRNLKEAQISFPALTQDQFDKLRDGRAKLTGDSTNGIEYVEVAPPR